MLLLDGFRLIALLASSTEGQESRIWNRDEIHWQEVNPDGSKYAVLEGNRANGGPFSYAFFFLMAFGKRLISIRVPLGLWWFQELCCLEMARHCTKAPRVPSPQEELSWSKDAPNWEGAKGDTLIIGVGMGPWKTTILTR